MYFVVQNCGTKHATGRNMKLYIRKTRHIEGCMFVAVLTEEIWYLQVHGKKLIYVLI
uniref:Uncharacterized protein n=1 Tax=viral metagenome TaxID=1070528 RepID=A0A6C0KBJ5_9ZZZZ